MKFRVERTSVWDDETQPCLEAVSEMIPRWDRRTFKSPEEHDAKLPHNEPWLSNGTEHRLVYGPRGGVIGIERRTGDVMVWFVTLDSLDDLIAFSDKYGALVVSAEPSIEIYDGYRE